MNNLSLDCPFAVQNEAWGFWEMEEEEKGKKKRYWGTVESSLKEEEKKCASSSLSSLQARGAHV